MANRLCDRTCGQILSLAAFAVAVGGACTSGSRRPDGNASPDASGDLSPGTTADAADDTASRIDTVRPWQPSCCLKPENVTLNALPGGPPCSFALGFALDGYMVGVGLHVLLNGTLVPGYTADGWSYDPQRERIVLAGSSCDTILSDPQNSIVQIFCNCSSPSI